MEDWEVETEVYEPKPYEGTTINTEIIAKETVYLCPTCKGHNYLKNNKCIRCDYKLV